jgi:hypothetical protein
MAEAVWNVGQAEQLILITDNRNLDSEESLEATIRRNNTPASLPVFTIADMSEFRTDNSYVERVVEALFDYLLRIDDVRAARPRPRFFTIRSFRSMCLRVDPVRKCVRFVIWQFVR